jgi:hypothetical protein
MIKSMITLLAFLSATIVAASDLDGIWNLTFIYDGDAHAEAISLKVEGNQVTGKWWDDDIHGTVSGDEIRLDFMRSDSRDPTMKEKTKKTVIEAKIYDRKVILSTIVVIGSSIGTLHSSLPGRESSNQVEIPNWTGPGTFTFLWKQ